MKEMPASNMALLRTRRPRFSSGRSLRSLASPLNAGPLGIEQVLVLAPRVPGFLYFLGE